jgi:hypothetical protein
MLTLEITKTATQILTLALKETCKSLISRYRVNGRLKLLKLKKNSKGKRVQKGIRVAVRRRVIAKYFELGSS